MLETPLAAAESLDSAQVVKQGEFGVAMSAAARGSILAKATSVTARKYVVDGMVECVVCVQLLSSVEGLDCN
jgi:hypothetical protein